ncbi:hypothetical protein J3A83DRAFT_4086327 [Scleroderma citrinum]
MDPCLSSKPITSLSSIKAAPLSSRYHFNHADEGLCGVAGSQKVILMLNSLRTGVTKISLNHNSLGDDGTCQLFAYLSSTEGSKHRSTVAEIGLTNNNIGCEGLRAIAEFVRGNDVLRTLWLTNNAFTPDPVILTDFANALNSSRLCLVSLTGNAQLGDLFVEKFLPFLRSRSLQELHINTIGLTPRGASAIAAWVSGSRKGGSQGACYLHIFKCSGNNLGVRGVWEVIRAIEKGNWALSKVEMYANQLAEPQLQLLASGQSLMEPPRDQPSGIPETEEGWKDCERGLHRVIMRNQYWRRRTEKEACNLLRYARPLLMYTKLPSTPSMSPHTSNPSMSTTLFPFFALPNELKLYILALFAPSLSSAQRVRIYKYASDPATLPSLIPTFRWGVGIEYLADPSNLGVSSYGLGCPDGKYMGACNTIICRREAERAKFLEAVGCCSYEPELEGFVD